MALETDACAIHFDGFVVTEVDGKQMSCDVHMFHVNPKWSKNRCTWVEAGVMTAGKDFKMGNGGTTIML